jgi:hypothetical protein
MQNVCSSIVWKILHEDLLYPYQIRVQALLPADYSSRVIFAQWYLQQCAFPNFEVSILFTDEANFSHDATINHHNNQMWFMQDGAPAHFNRNAREFLNNNYTNRWIGRRGPIAWPARSPDLNPLEYYLRGHLKTIVYDTPVATVEVLRNRIIAGCEKY